MLFLSFLSIIIFFSYKFCAGDFSNMRRPIFVKFSGMIDIHLNFIRIFLFFETSNITSYIDVFVKFWVSFCPEVFSETVRDINFQFSGIVDEISKLCIGAIKFHSREKRQSSP